MEEQRQGGARGETRDDDPSHQQPNSGAGKKSMGFTDQRKDRKGEEQKARRFIYIHTSVIDNRDD